MGVDPDQSETDPPLRDEPRPWKKDQPRPMGAHLRHDFRTSVQDICPDLGKDGVPYLNALDKEWGLVRDVLGKGHPPRP
ncbi:hypothetical protein SESBI_09424 [Sesbania bispinosa]|nr:hypothetical protein SESBI_09424 [Sesbania bispinosa]